MIRKAKVAIDAAVPERRMIASPSSKATTAGRMMAPPMASGKGNWFSCRNSGNPCSMICLKLGSAVAQELAIAHPAKVRGLVLWGTWPALDAFQACGLTAFSYPWRNGDAQAGTAALGLAFSPELLNSPDFPAMMEQLLPFYPQTEAEVRTVVEQWDADLAHNTTDRLPGITAPTLVIGGEQDLLTPPWQCAKVAELIPGAQLKIFAGPGSSHAVGLERTEEFLAEVLPFLAAVPAPATA